MMTAIVYAATSIIVAFVAYFLTKAREREADWRKQKLEYYRELLEAIFGIVKGDGSSENQRRFAKATNVIGLVASQEVIAAMHRMQECSRADAPVSNEEHDAALAELLLAIRRDLGVRPKDDPRTFKYRLWTSGADKSADV